MIVFDVIFYIVACLLIACSLLVILAKNPMISVLALVFAFVNASVLFILLHAEFIAMVMLIIYVGAIAVLFIFVIMLLRIRVLEKKKIITKNFVFGAILSIAIFIEILVLINGGFSDIPSLKNIKLVTDTNNSYNLGLSLFNNYYSLLVILGLLLTVVVVGIISVCYEEYDIGIYKQRMSKQSNRDPKTCVKVVKVDNEKGIKL